ncbi:uncharacterized protein PAC_14052 [Phialocephala subalpina]|uniref:Uncharacterized protein n=1 Tax=Phialocephala subalpina TaxID=576137 RepID=A0A1L7XGI6_9HELO|nr:uncharacterized protein PAC_14052 [Phialocephala subalpina]
MPPNIAVEMTPEVQVAVVEALYLLQAFSAAIVSLQIVQFFLFSRFKDAHKIVIYTVAPLLGFIQVFTVLTQIRAIGRSHKMNVDFEWIKSGIVTALWLWLAIESGVSKWGSDAHMTVACVLSLLFIAQPKPTTFHTESHNYYGAHLKPWIKNLQSTDTTVLLDTTATNYCTHSAVKPYVLLYIINLPNARRRRQAFTVYIGNSNEFQLHLRRFSRQFRSADPITVFARTEFAPFAKRGEFVLVINFGQVESKLIGFKFMDLRIMHRACSLR